ncbi:MAG TPA: hypothetical protein VHK03_07295 [Aestuariivirgaceae bacterium]|nr:hypothetical protein [Aestuariivirgaceae bacterium]
MAEKERAMISARTKAALTAAKQRGVTLGNPQLVHACIRAEAVRKAAAVEYAMSIEPVIRSIQAPGITTLSGLARELAARKRNET